jgi:acetyl esterase/lipase
MLKGIGHGFAVVCVNYRLSDEALFPSQIFDCKAAVRFLRAQAATYGLDGSRIAVWGASAGAHLAALLGTSAHVEELEDLSMGNAGFSSGVQAVVTWSGPSESFLTMDEELDADGLGPGDHSSAHSSADSPESRLLGDQITRIPELVRWASPMTYITPDVPPFLVQHGEVDRTVSVWQSINFASRLAEIAGREKVLLDVLPGVGHHGDPGFETPENLQRVFRFLARHLG